MTAIALSGIAVGWLDGFVGAPVVPPQLPNLLNGYAARPPWHVAGVDYGVGVPTAKQATYLDPATLPSSGNIFANPATGAIHINASNQTLDNYDCSLATATGGKSWFVTIDAGVANTTIQNCNWVWSSNTPSGAFFFIQQNGTPGSGLTVQLCNFNGGQVNSATSASAAINFDQPGFVCQYCYFQGMSNDVIDCAWSPIVRWVLSNGHGYYSGNDGDGVQMDPANPSSGTPRYGFTTFYQPATAPFKANSMLQATANPGVSIINANVANNTIIVAGSNTVNVAIEINRLNNTQGLNDGAVIANNYMDITGVFASAFYSASQSNSPTNATYSNNINMVTGGVIPPPT